MYNYQYSDWFGLPVINCEDILNTLHQHVNLSDIKIKNLNFDVLIIS